MSFHECFSFILFFFDGLFFVFQLPCKRRQGVAVAAVVVDVVRFGFCLFLSDCFTISFRRDHLKDICTLFLRVVSTRT